MWIIPDRLDLEDIFEALELENAALERLSRRVARKNNQEARLQGQRVCEL